MLKNLTGKIERIFMAIPYATVLEHQSALEIAGYSPSRDLSLRQIFQKIEASFAASAFAFSGCHETALTFLDTEPNILPISHQKVTKGLSLSKLLFSKQPAT